MTVLNQGRVDWGVNLLYISKAFYSKFLSAALARIPKIFRHSVLEKPLVALFHSVKTAKKNWNFLKKKLVFIIKKIIIFIDKRNLLVKSAS